MVKTVKDDGKIKNKAGFTLMEVIFILAVLGIVMALAVPRISFSGKWELEATAQKMAANMRLARQEAVTKASLCKIDFYVHSSCYLVVLSGESHCVELPREVKFKGTTTFSGSPPSVFFSSLGRPSSGGTVILTTKDEEHKLYVIMVPVTGRVRISKEPPSHW